VDESAESIELAELSELADHAATQPSAIRVSERPIFRR